MRITATEAKNRFGAVCASAKTQPVFVEKAGEIDTVILSLQQYEALQSPNARAHVTAKRRAFEAEFRGWIDAQNELVESQGVPGADLRPW